MRRRTSIASGWARNRAITARDLQSAPKLEAFIKTGKPVLLTDGLVARLTNEVNLAASNVQVLRVQGSPKSLLDMSPDKVDALRPPLLRPLKTSLRAPT